MIHYAELLDTYSSHSFMGSRLCTGIAEIEAGVLLRSLKTNTRSKFRNEN